MKRGVIIVVLTMLAGCTSIQEIAHSVPDAAGTAVSTAIFGGEVSMVPHPEGYVKDEINRESRRIYRDSRRSVKDGIADTIRGGIDGGD